MVEKKTYCLRGALKIRIYKMSLASGGLPPDPLIFRITDFHLLHILPFHLSLGLFTIVFVNNVTFCQTEGYKKFNVCESMCT